jgi:hypothetical protein
MYWRVSFGSLDSTYVLGPSYSPPILTSIVPHIGKISVFRYLYMSVYIYVYVYIYMYEHMNTDTYMELFLPYTNLYCASYR